MSENKKDCCLMKTVCTLTAVSVCVLALHLTMNTDGKRKKKFVSAVENAIDTAIGSITDTAEKISAEIFDK